MNYYRKAADALTIVVFLWAVAMLIGFVPKFSEFAALHESAVKTFEAAQALTPELKANVLKLWNAEAASNGLLAISWTGFAAASLILALLSFLAGRRDKGQPGQ